MKTIELGDLVKIYLSKNDDFWVIGTISEFGHEWIEIYDRQTDIKNRKFARVWKDKIYMMYHMGYGEGE